MYVEEVGGEVEALGSVGWGGSFSRMVDTVTLGRVAAMVCHFHRFRDQGRVLSGGEGAGEGGGAVLEAADEGGAGRMSILYYSPVRKN